MKSVTTDCDTNAADDDDDNARVEVDDNEDEN